MMIEEIIKKEMREKTEKTDNERRREERIWEKTSKLVRKSFPYFFLKKIFSFEIKVFRNMKRWCYNLYLKRIKKIRNVLIWKRVKVVLEHQLITKTRREKEWKRRERIEIEEKQQQQHQQQQKISRKRKVKIHTSTTRDESVKICFFFLSVIGKKTKKKTEKRREQWRKGKCSTPGAVFRSRLWR